MCDVIMRRNMYDIILWRHMCDVIMRRHTVDQTAFSCWRSTAVITNFKFQN